MQTAANVVVQRELLCSHRPIAPTQPDFEANAFRAIASSEPPRHSLAMRQAQALCSWSATAISSRR